MKPKEFVDDEVQPDRKISHIQFGMLSPAEAARVAEFEVVNNQIYEPPTTAAPSRVPAADGVLDRRLGVSDKHRSRTGFTRPPGRATAARSSASRSSTGSTPRTSLAAPR